MNLKKKNHDLKDKILLTRPRDSLCGMMAEKTIFASC